jgi:hypothetical protein
MIYEMKTSIETKQSELIALIELMQFILKTLQIKLAKVVTFNEGKGG